jgi:hypothetical protein
MSRESRTLTREGSQHNAGLRVRSRGVLELRASGGDLTSSISARSHRTCMSNMDLRDDAVQDDCLRRHSWPRPSYARAPPLAEFVSKGLTSPS